jgi:hypothetical protein
MTIGGTDYYSDVTFDLSLLLGGDFRAQHTATVVKTNVSHLYPLGRKLVDLTYERLVREVTTQEPIKQFEPSILPAQPAQPEPKVRAISLDDLLGKAEEYGIAEVHGSKAAARYCGGKRLEQLNAIEIELLYNRLVESRGPEATEIEQGPGTRSDRRSTPRETDASANGSGIDTIDPGETVGYTRHVESGEPVASGARSNGRVRS